MNIRRATLNDVDTIVKIHLDAFKGFFLTSLGSQFLKFYYSCFIKSSETVTMVAEEDGVIYGFSASTKACKGFNNRLIKSNLFAFASGLNSLLHRDILRRICANPNVPSKRGAQRPHAAKPEESSTETKKVPKWKCVRANHLLTNPTRELQNFHR